MSNSNQFHIKSKDLLERLTGYRQWFKKAVAKGWYVRQSQIAF